MASKPCGCPHIPLAHTRTGCTGGVAHHTPIRREPCLCVSTTGFRNARIYCWSCSHPGRLHTHEGCVSWDMRFGSAPCRCHVTRRELCYGID